MNYHYDLHVHSVLSPCADVLMTPNNLFNMANLKGLDILSITDHNSLKQLPVLERIAQSYALLFVPGVEVTIRDGSHILCYFRHSDEAMAFDRELEAQLDKTPEGPVRIGEATITDDEDLTVAVLPYRLHQNLPIDLPALCAMLDRYDHLRFFAHVDRPTNSGLGLIGTMPMDGVEISPNAHPGFLQEHGLTGLVTMYNSDAHDLTAIAERRDDNVIDLPELTMEALFRRLRRG